MPQDVEGPLGAAWHVGDARQRAGDWSRISRHRFDEEIQSSAQPLTTDPLCFMEMFSKQG